jgi:hypothetical protein
MYLANPKANCIFIYIYISKWSIKGATQVHMEYKRGFPLREKKNNANPNILEN